MAALHDRLLRELQAGHKVLWLLTGGSSIPISVSIMNQLPDESTSNLTIMLSDERYGPVGHADSNATQLLAAGFNSKRASVIPVLLPDMPLEATARHFQAEAKKVLQDAAYVIAQFGIGADGHLAGILPDSEAVSSPDLATAFQSDPYTRLTLTFHALKRINAAYAFVYGVAKRPALEKLQGETLPYAEQPAQILKELPESYVFNDQIGETG